jgi:hypothetical protein
MAGFITNLLGGAMGDTVAKIVGAFKVPPEKVLESQVQLAQIQADLEKTVQGQITAQLAVNQAEASNASMFVAGWRPFIGWVCGVGLATQFLIGPLFTWAAALAGQPIVFPSLDMGTLLTLLLGMLGLGTMRTYEKVSAAPGAKNLH